MTSAGVCTLSSEAAPFRWLRGLCVAGRVLLWGVAYDSNMRRFVLCLLLCLMPMRLWAGAWMPTVQGLEHPQPTAVLTSSAHHPAALMDAGHPAALVGGEHHGCHDTPLVVQAMESLVATEVFGALGEDSQHSDCHDGTCQWCGVCHQSAHVAVWPWFLPVHPSYSLPLGPLRQSAGQAFALPLKPPIS